MKKEQLIHIGTFGKAQGLNGEIKINILTSSLESFKLIDQYFLEGDLFQFNFKTFRYSGKKIIASVSNFKNRNDATKLNNKKIFTLRKNFPENKKNEFYVADLLGCEVLNLNEKKLGQITNVKNFGAGDLLEIKKNQKTFFIPMNNENLKEINIKKKIIIVDPIKGLLD
tara:strand:+ start:80 stop:586 length:507 start_codon:yes stop_codon:yes gene_type:complete